MQVGPEDDMSLPYQSLGKIFYDEIKKKALDRIIIVDETTNEEVSYGQLLKVSSKLASALTELKVKKRDVITILSENNWKALASIIACFFIGATVNLLNHNYTSEELKYLLNISQPILVFCDKKTLEKTLELKNKSIFIIKNIIIYDNPSFDEILNFDELITKTMCEFYKPIDLDPKKTAAFILTSSGTTGLPKCVMLTHANFRITVLSANDAKGIDLNDQQSTLTYLPFFHIFGGGLSLACILYGTKQIILNQFEPIKFLSLIENHKITKLFAVPPIIQFLAKSPLVNKYNISSMKDIICGGAIITKELLEAVEKKLNIKEVRQLYGLTELSGPVTVSPKGTCIHSTVGKVVKTYSIKVCNNETGKILSPYQNGELRVSGPGVVKSYLKNEDEFQDVFDEEGYFKTGDIGYYDKNGYFYIVDRLKEIIKCKGFQVSPTELESLLIQHPSVKDAGVIGIPDERAGEIPLAFVVKQPNMTVTEKELIHFVEEKVSVHKRLYGGIRFIDEIPKNPSGKILRRKLRELLHT